MVKKVPPKRLGRGLAALLGDQAPELARVGSSSKETTLPHQPGTLPIDLLAPSPFQPRVFIDSDLLSELADSIRSRGVIQPLLVRSDPDKKGYYQIIAGERRWRASQMAGLHTVPVHVCRLDDTDAMAAAMVENLQRSDLNPVEEAMGLQRLLQDYRLTQEELAGAVGKSRSHITNTMRLLSLPEKVLRCLREGQISAGHARALLSHPDPVVAMTVVLEKGLNVRQTEAFVAQAHKTDRGVIQKRVTPPEITRLEDDLSMHLGLKAKINFNGKKGSLKISYQSLEQFEGLIDILKNKN